MFNLYIQQRFNNIFYNLFYILIYFVNVLLNSFSFIFYNLIKQSPKYFFIPKMKRILAIMTINPDYIQFAVPELKSILSQLPIPLTQLFKQQLTIQPKHSYEITHQTLRNFPYVTLNVPDFDKHKAFFQKACKQSVMLHKLVLLIAKGSSYDELIKSRDEEFLKQHCRNWEDSVLCDFISRNRVLGRTYHLQKITKVFGDFDIRGKIDLQKPSKRYQLIEDHIWYQQHHQSPIESTLKTVYFGLQLCTNKIGTAKFNTKYELSKRIYLGPTSADNDLAFMMCNQAKIQQGSFVLDPFVGTGGLIIPPASKGAHVFGCDLDMRVLNGYSVGRINKRSPYYDVQKKFEVFTPKITLNFEQYGFNFPNIFRMDSTNLAFKKEEIFDAIITDPPYGLRAMSRSVSSKQQLENVESKEKQNNELLQAQQIKMTKCEQKIAEISISQQNQEVIQVVSEEKQSEIPNLTVQSQIQPTANTQQLTPEQLQKLKKQEKRRVKKENKQTKKGLLTEEQKQYKKNIVQKLNRERIDQWDKFDKTKVQCTERQKIFQRLISFSRLTLKRGGRLVFLYPIYEEEQYKRVDSLPNHDGFTVIDMSENKLSKNNSRILVTLQKL